MTNADDIFAELAAVREFIARRDYRSALQAVEQAQKLWSAERDYWADIERQAVLAEREPVAREMSVRWGRRTDTGGMDDGDWRSSGIA